MRKHGREDWSTGIDVAISSGEMSPLKEKIEF
jgi:hypothetical protein